jgi:VWFA-related protein
MTVRLGLAASLCCALTISFALAAQQQETPRTQRPVFRGGTQLVRVDAYPTGKDGRIIEGLTADDFEIFEDGKPQKVETFEFDRFETWTPDGERKDPKSQQEAYDLAADPAWRIFVIVIDPAAYNMEGQHYLRAPLREFIERDLGPHDLFGLLTTENDWTDLTLGQQTTVADAVLDSQEWITDPFASEKRAYFDQFCAGPLKKLDNEYALLEGLVKLLGMIREEKKSILFVSNGLATPQPGRGGGTRNLAMPSSTLPANPGGRGGPMGHGDAIGGMAQSQACEAERRRLQNIDFLKRFHELLDDARHANVAFYPINSRGLEAPPIHVDRSGIVTPTQVFHELDTISHRNDSLLTLAENTDGIAVVNTNDFATGVRRIANDVQAYYILGYYPTNSQFDGTVRTIKVRLKSTGRNVRARHQYRAPTLTEISRGPESAKSSLSLPVKAALDRLTVSIDRDARGTSVPPDTRPSTLVEDAIAWKRGGGGPILTFAFDRVEQVRLEWRTLRAVDHVDARLLDRTGHPLPAPIPAVIDASRSPVVVVSELPLASLAHGDYVLELMVTAGAATETKFTAFRVR